jgi:hypothetical protein
MNGRQFSTAATATIALVAATLGAAATDSEAKWTRPLTVARCDCLGFPVLTTSARGGSVVAWQDNDGRLTARRIRRDGTLGRKHTLAKRAVELNNEWAWIATGPSGASVAVWQEWDADDQAGGIRARRLTLRGKLGRIHRIAQTGPAGTLDGAVAVDAAGNATIAWSGVPSLGGSPDHPPAPTTTVRARRLTVKGERGPPIHLRLGEQFNDHPRVAVAPSGRATVTWRVCCGLNAIATTTIGRNGKAGAISDLSGQAGGSEPELAMDARGNAIVVWPGYFVMARRIRAGGALGPVHVLGPGDPWDSHPRVAFDRTGDASVVWWHSDSIQFRRIGANDTLGPLANLSGPGSNTLDLPDFESPAVAVDPVGNATAAWLAGPHANLTGTSGRIQARTVAPGGELGAITTLFSAVRLTRPEIVADARGVVTVAWSEARPDYHGATIRVARLVERRGR